MFDKLAESMAFRCAKKGIYEQELIAQYAYGYKLLLSTVTSASIVLLIGLIFASVAEAAVFMIAFAILRSVAGGFHAQTHKVCLIAFSSIFLVSTLFVNVLIPEYILSYFPLLAVVSCVIVFLKAPVAAQNKPIPTPKRNKLRRICIVISCINIFIALLVTIFTVGRFAVISSYFLGFFTASLSLFTTKKRG